MEQTCALRFTRYYRASPGEVWAALTEPASVARWLGAHGGGDLVPGARWDAGALTARVRAVEVERLLELDWTVRGEDASVVRFQLRPDGKGTVLELDHRRLDAALGMRALRLWGRRLGRLDSLLGAEEP